MKGGVPGSVRSKRMLLAIGLIIFCTGFLGADSTEPSLVVKIPDGEIQGHFSKSYGGKEYIEFTGIPYAKPPIDNLRFKDPVKPNPWTGTLIANKTSECIQVAHYTKPHGGILQGSEDCLYLNIYIPDKKFDLKKKRDVIIYIHGGAFMFGSYKFGGPKFLMDKDAILVNFNYRVGVLGFLSTGDANLPGNMGMKDQAMAIEWVRENIEHFGGNKNSITLAGLSAGGASVHFHYLSPLTKGMFQAGISMSGTVLNSWTMQEEPLVKARIIGESLGCPQEDTKELVDCLHGKPVEHLTESIKILRPWLFNPFSPLGVVVDAASEKPFLPEHPYKMLAEKKVMDVPWISSVTTSEGLYPSAEFLTEEDHMKDLNSNWDEYAPAILHYMETIPDELKSLVNEKIKLEYLQDREISTDTFNEVTELIGDRLFVADWDKAIRLHASAVEAPIYGYIYDYIGEKRVSLVNLIANLEGNYGVSHGDDGLFVISFAHEDIPEKLTEKDESVKELLLNVWTSFAKTKRPAILPHWLPVSTNPEDNMNYLYIGRQMELEMKTAPEVGRRSFWESLPFQENDNIVSITVKDEL